MNEKNNGRGIFYGVIGVATLVVAIIGATFAYFTATATDGAEEINGNMAEIKFGVKVTKVVDPGATSGMIPMSNTMVHPAVTNTNICVDNNGNAVCQIYKVTVTNESSAAMFVDGYVALKGGSGNTVDIKDTKGLTRPKTGGSEGETETYDYAPTENVTSMRWAQAFCETYTAEDAETQGDTPTKSVGDIKSCSTAGTQKLAVDGTSANVTIASLDAKTASDNTGYNKANILTQANQIVTTNGITISGTSYNAIKQNYIRVSDHATVTPEGSTDAVLSTSFTRSADPTSMLVLSQQLSAASDAVTTDEATYYFVLWLTETGTNQTAGAVNGGTAESPTTNPAKDNFFSGVVTFNSAQGSEVSATFQGFHTVPSDVANQ